MDSNNQTVIAAIGTSTPQYRSRQHETAELICAGFQLKPAEKRLLKSIYKATGIEYRHSVLSDYCKKPGELEFFPNNPEAPYPTTSARMQVYKNNALNLAVAAVQNCLNNIPQFNTNTITHLITVSCTGMYAPGIDFELVEKFKLSSNIKRTAINFMGCYGAFNALKLADSICKAEPNAKVLIVSVEICTIHFQKNMAIDNMIANSIFADGAAAVIIQDKQKLNKYFALESFYCDLIPEAQQQMAWCISDSGFDITLSSYVPDTIQHGIPSFTEKLLQQYGISFANIDFFAIHPGGLKILQACEKSLNINEHDNRYSYQILKSYGNMSSATILFVLKAIWDDIDTANQNNSIFSCAFGPGLTLESMILKIGVA